MTQADFDILVFTEPRFPGGTSSSVAADVGAFSKAGLKVGLGLVESTGFFPDDISDNPNILRLLDLPGVEQVALTANTAISCDVAFFHNPLAFERPLLRAVKLHAGAGIMVAHQPPFSGGNRTLTFDPFGVQRTIKDQFGISVKWAPVSGICRAQLRAYAPFIRQTTLDWPNSFGVGDWTPSRAKLQSSRLTIGRHGRPHIEKWPTTGRQIALSLPAGAQTDVCIMGADKAFLEEKGVDVSNWEILEFNQRPVRDFLDELDVFCYHHSPRWVEAFGRTIAEAMLMGVRCILSPQLERTFGPHAHYCEPEDVPAILDVIRANLHAEREAALVARQYCIDAYSDDNIVNRFEALKADPGTIARHPKPSVSALTATRKFIGLHRRRNRWAKKGI